jgi:hypothetical protein
MTANDFGSCAPRKVHDTEECRYAKRTAHPRVARYPSQTTCETCLKARRDHEEDK